ncbi:EF-hand calcium-binding domain-containing protein 6 [Notolabrus celidotus]|uniref:EF-hand calcium-binding domain-containing protein 6 n=1 Tax=Notolabrus celidotus TaxID=1203425 RepID=UPI001490220E|nr:EF-hand calcium-binding domain-containing protein 6 [Notolabrus celidotus]
MISRRPHTAPSTHTSTRGWKGGGGKQAWLHTNKGWQLTFQPVEPLISDRLEDIKSAFRAVDPRLTGHVSKEEFRRVLRPDQNRLQTVVNQVCESSAETVDYLQFLRSFSRAPAACRASGSRCSVRCGPQKSPMSVSEIEKHLKEKIGGNLRNMIRVFRLFDYNRGGHIQLQEFRRILDNYCIRLSDKEFQRLWNHYTAKNSSTISYELFLEKLGFGDSHNFRISPVCTKLEVCSRGKTPPEQIKQRKQRPADPSVLPHRELQTLFFDKMCMNSTSVWRALQAFDATRSGLVTQEVLRAVLSSFVFPMSPHSFQKLTSRYGGREKGGVRWKQFLGHFMNPVKEDEDTNDHTDRVSEPPAQDKDNLLFQDIYPQLKEIFHLLDQRQADWITRADLRIFLQKPGETKNLLPRLGPPQIIELLQVLDPEHTGVIQKANVEKLNPNITPGSTVNAATPPVSPNTDETDRELKSSDEIPTTQSDDNMHVASASQRTVEDVLQEKLCEQQLGAALEALKLCDPELRGNVTREDLKTVLSCCGISDTHFNKPATSPQCMLKSDRHSPPLPSNLKPAQSTCSILDVVFQAMKVRLEERQSRLADRVQAVTQRSEETLSERDVRKVLEDSSVILDDKDFSKFIGLLGFRDRRIESSSFLQKYNEFTDGRTWTSCEGRGDEGEVDRLLTTAEQCMAAMKTRIKSIHGDYLMAFRLMDTKHKGMVDRHDFKDLYDSLGFFCREPEHERLLDLIGLHPGGNLNYAEFVDVVENKGKQKPQPDAARVQQQLHELLSSEVRCKWADVSKVLCPFDSDAQGWIHKNSLRTLLFTYSLPLTSDQFDRLWLRYDPEQRGRVVVRDFMEKLGLQQDQKRPEISDAASWETKEDFMSAFENQSEKKKKSGHPPVTPDALRHIQSLDDLSPAAALARMRDLVSASASDLYKAFSAFDQSRTGAVTALQFRQVLENFCACLSDKQYRYMLSKVELDCESCSVNWEDFLNKFTSHSPTMSAEIKCKTRSPLRTPDIQKDVSDHLYEITKELLDLDSSALSEERLRLLCDPHSRSLTDDQLECVQSQTPVNKQKKPQYREFLKRFRARSVTPHSLPEPRGSVSAGAVLQRTQSALRCSSRRPAPAGRPGTVSPPGSVERRLRGAVQRCWKEIQRSCREEDPQDEGLISTACFLRILQSLSISVTQEQFEHLAVKFDIMSNGCVSYHDFLRHFLLNLKPAETETVIRRRKLPLPTQVQMSRGVLSRSCIDAMLRIYDVVHSSWTSIRRCFLTSDRAHTGNVSTQDFRKVLRHFSVDLSEEEFFHLSSYFDADTKGKICYNNFLWTFLH